MSCWEWGWSAYLSPNSFAVFLYYERAHHGPLGSWGEEVPPTLERLDPVAQQVPGLVDVAEKLVVVWLWGRGELSPSPAPGLPRAPLPALGRGLAEGSLLKTQ